MITTNFEDASKFMSPALLDSISEAKVLINSTERCGIFYCVNELIPAGTYINSCYPGGDSTDIRDNCLVQVIRNEKTSPLFQSPGKVGSSQFIGEFLDDFLFLPKITHFISRSANPIVVPISLISTSNPYQIRLLDATAQPGPQYPVPLFRNGTVTMTSVTDRVTYAPAALTTDQISGMSLQEVRFTGMIIISESINLSNIPGILWNRIPSKKEEWNNYYRAIGSPIIPKPFVGARSSKCRATAAVQLIDEASTATISSHGKVLVFGQEVVDDVVVVSKGTHAPVGLYAEELCRWRVRGAQSKSEAEGSRKTSMLNQPQHTLPLCKPYQYDSAYITSPTACDALVDCTESNEKGEFQTVRRTSELILPGQ